MTHSKATNYAIVDLASLWIRSGFIRASDCKSRRPTEAALSHGGDANDAKLERILHLY